MSSTIKFHFKSNFDDFETEAKGYRNDVFVELPTGEIFEVFFYEPTRLSQDLGVGEYLSRPGLIILNTVNKKSIINSVTELWQKGYFNYFKPLTSIANNHFEENI
jgi:hypothetical protein